MTDLDELCRKRPSNHARTDDADSHAISFSEVLERNVVSHAFDPMLETSTEEIENEFPHLQARGGVT
jgi:hypothetical protein